MEQKLRSVARGLVTKRVNALRVLLENHDITLLNCKTGLAKLEAAEMKLMEANALFNKTLTEETFEAEMAASDEYDEQVIEYKVKLSEKIRELSIVDNQNISVNVDNRESNVVRLPKVYIRKFSGEFKDWLPFWKQFESLVDQNVNYDDIAKFNYLQSLLVGKAANLIGGIVASNESYVQAVEILKEEYASTERIVESIVHELGKQSTIRDMNNSIALRKLYNAVSTAIRSFNALAVDVDRYGLIIKSTLNRYLPNEFRIDYYKNKHSNEFTTEEELKAMVDFLKVNLTSLTSLCRW